MDFIKDEKLVITTSKEWKENCERDKKKKKAAGLSKNQSDTCPLTRTCLLNIAHKSPLERAERWLCEFAYVGKLWLELSMARFGDFAGYLLRGVKYTQTYAYECVRYVSWFVYSEVVRKDQAWPFAASSSLHLRVETSRRRWLDQFYSWIRILLG